MHIWRGLASLRCTKEQEKIPCLPTPHSNLRNKSAGELLGFANVWWGNGATFVSRYLLGQNVINHILVRYVNSEYSNKTNDGKFLYWEKGDRCKANLGLGQGGGGAFGHETTCWGGGASAIQTTKMSWMGSHHQGGIEKSCGSWNDHDTKRKTQKAEVKRDRNHLTQ